MSFRFNFDFHLTVNNLVFNEINGVRWNTLKNSLFRHGTTTQITGNSKEVNTLYLHHYNSVKTCYYFRELWIHIISNILVQLNLSVPFSGNLQIKGFNTYYLHSNNIAERSVDAALTSTTDQNIYATVHFANVDVPNVICNTINGINITKEAAVSNELNEETIRGIANRQDIIMHHVNFFRLVPGPVNAMNINIHGNLHLLPAKILLIIYKEQLYLTCFKFIIRKWQLPVACDLVIYCSQMQLNYQ